MKTFKYHIYQLDYSLPTVKNSHKMFASWDILIKYEGGFDIKDYKEVYSGEIEGVSEKIILEELFEQFNLRHPEDFHGHSMSVSDVVVLNGTMYYCDSIGWKKL